MDAGRFWEIIETARASARRDRPLHEALTDHLATLTEQDILEYCECFEKMHGALYRRDLWAAAYLIAGGCRPSRCGRRQAPARRQPLFYEEVNYAASAAFQRLSGDEQVSWDALAARGPRDGLPELGEDFDGQSPALTLSGPHPDFGLLARWLRIR